MWLRFQSKFNAFALLTENNKRKHFTTIVVIAILIVNIFAITSIVLVITHSLGATI